VTCSPGGAIPIPRGAARGFPHFSSVRCGPAVPARPGPAGRSDTAVVPPRPTIMPDGPGPAMPQVTAVDDQFDTQRPACAGSAARWCRYRGPGPEGSVSAAGRGGVWTLPRGDRVCAPRRGFFGIPSVGSPGPCAQGARPPRPRQTAARRGGDRSTSWPLGDDASAKIVPGVTSRCARSNGGNVRISAVNIA